ncbi:TlpA family protein disulfide reductase [Flammeovirga agarivorans]|uniref:TlpA family protein disulfide reductase n=1 Tax=Flammeovirga agarivorans TaxID=2726742 RepID=A0A7X8SNN4_9BACT|nr:TlpA disulfide reductase family protein [Flammeovirga agarivorans]NLR93457.1 TlpA family protein disulfide reductase [Flammeovirga agarivorans]
MKYSIFFILLLFGCSKNIEPKDILLNALTNTQKHQNSKFTVTIATKYLGDTTIYSGIKQKGTILKNENDSIINYIFEAGNDKVIGIDTGIISIDYSKSKAEILNNKQYKAKNEDYRNDISRTYPPITDNEKILKRVLDSTTVFTLLDSGNFYRVLTKTNTTLENKSNSPIKINSIEYIFTINKDNNIIEKYEEISKANFLGKPDKQHIIKEISDYSFDELDKKLFTSQNIEEFITIYTKDTDEIIDLSINENYKLDYNYHKKYTLLDFSYSSCYPCLLSIPIISNLHNDFNNVLDIVMIDFDDNEEKIDQLKKNYKIQYKILNDSTNEITNNYNIKVFPTLLLLDKDGNVINQYYGYSDDLYDVISQKLI